MEINKCFINLLKLIQSSFQFNLTSLIFSILNEHDFHCRMAQKNSIVRCCHVIHYFDIRAPSMAIIRYYNNHY